METILNLIQNYYGGIIGSGISLGAIVKLVINWFNTYVIKNMLVLEKDTTLTNEQKFQTLCGEIYDGLPLIVKMFIGKNLFASLSQGLYDKMFPKKPDTNTPVVDANSEIKQAIANIITDAIDALDKNTDTKIQEMTKQIQIEKSNDLTKIADTLKQSLGVKEEIVVVPEQV